MNETTGAIQIAESGAFVETFDIEPKGSGLLDGLEFAAKDLIDVEGYKTSCGKPLWRDSHPVAVTNAVYVDQLLFAGARCFGKTITDELAFSLNGENHFYGTPLNPKAPKRVPGRSSSGSASSVACGLVDFAMGSDTRESVRVPASNCGIFGFRPTYGAISVAGVNPLAPSFDTVGCFARDLEVLCNAISVLEGCDVPSGADVRTIDILRDAFDSADAEVVEALKNPISTVTKRFHGKIRETSLSHIDPVGQTSGLPGWYETYCRIQWAEIWSCLGSWITQVKPKFGPRITKNFELVRNYDRDALTRAVRERERL